MNFVYNNIWLGLLAAVLFGFVCASSAAWALFKNFRTRRMDENEAKLGVLRTELDQSSKQRTELEAISRAAKADKAQIKSLEEKLRSQEQAASSDRDSKVKEIAALNSKVESIQVALAENEQSASQLAKSELARLALQDQLFDQQRSRERWQAQSEAAASERESRMKDLDAKLVEAQGVIPMLREQAANAGARREAAENQAREMEREVRNIMTLRDEEFREMEAESLAMAAAQKRLEQNTAQIRAEVEARDAEIVRLKETLAGLQASLSERNESASRLEADAALLSHVRIGMRERQTRIEGLALQLRQVRWELAAKEPTLAGLRESLSERDRQIQLLEQNLVAASVNSPEDGRVRTLESELQDIRANLFDRNEAISRLEADAALLSHMRQSMRQRQTRIDGLRLQLEQSRAQTVELQRQLAGAAQASSADRRRTDDRHPDFSEPQARLRLVSLRGIQFHPEDHEIMPESNEPLHEALDTLRALDAEARVEIGGHTDSWGDHANNRELSQRRAESVRRYLVEHGVRADMLIATGYGDSRPIADNASADGRFANRRIEFQVRGTVR